MWGAGVPLGGQWSVSDVGLGARMGHWVTSELIQGQPPETSG